jgi:hypothetical protein
MKQEHCLQKHRERFRDCSEKQIQAQIEKITEKIIAASEKRTIRITIPKRNTGMMKKSSSI